MGKRIYQRDIEEYDAARGESFIRRLEMTIEGATTKYNDVGLVLQFFRDLTTYGLDEAIAYTRHYENAGLYKPDTTKELKKIADEIHSAIGISQFPPVEKAEDLGSSEWRKDPKDNAWYYGRPEWDNSAVILGEGVSQTKGYEWCIKDRHTGECIYYGVEASLEDAKRVAEKALNKSFGL